MARRRNATRSGLEAADAAEVRGHANRASAVAADAARRTSRGNGRGFAAARSARSFRQVPGVLCATVQRIVGLVPHQHLGHVGRAQDDGSGAAEACDNRGVAHGDTPATRRTSRLAPEPGDLDGALHRDGKTAQGPSGHTPDGGGVLPGRFVERRLGAHLNERVQLVRSSGNPIEMRPNQVGRGHLARGHPAHQFSCGKGQQSTLVPLNPVLCTPVL